MRKLLLSAFVAVAGFGGALSLGLIPSMPLQAAQPAPAPWKAYTAEGLAAAGTNAAPVLLHIHADWCTTCRAQMPVLQKLLSEPAFKNYTAIRVDFDRETAFRKEYRVNQQSTLILLKGGRELGRSTAQTGEAALRDLMSKGIGG